MEDREQKTKTHSHHSVLAGRLHQMIIVRLIYDHFCFANALWKSTVQKRRKEKYIKLLCNGANMNTRAYKIINKSIWKSITIVYRLIFLCMVIDRFFCFFLVGYVIIILSKLVWKIFTYAETLLAQLVQ